jgi:hypothetical protein
MINPPLASTAIGVVHHSRSGMASGINSTFRQVGIATGIAGLGAVFQHEVTHSTASALAASGQAHAVTSAAHRQLSTVLQSGEVGKLMHTLSPTAQGALSHAYKLGFTEAFGTILIIAAAVAFAGAVLAFLLVRQRDFVTSGAPEGEQAPAAEQVGAVAG